PEDDYVPAGPFGAHAAHAGDELAAACRPADVVLTLAVLDPALGGDYLAGWADDAVVVVTAGRSSAAAVHAAGEMLRLAGLTGISAVLVAADKSDESLGSSHSLAPARSAPRAPAAESLSGQVPPEFAGHSALDRSAR
ncbi:MAG TPA: hypothetical protein VLX31_00855, partial [Streptosporangiaceae bacterium]|nr:hypothetical protein [Streptosporangiaceae bacterium]